MGLKDLLLHFGLSDEDAEKVIAEGLPQYRANVAYNESIRDLAKLDSVEDFLD